jgi:hypothetical protein
MSTKRRLPEKSAQQLDLLDEHLELAIQVLTDALEDIQRDPKHCATQIHHARFLLVRALRHSDRARRNED